MMNPVKKCNVIWASCFAVMTAIAILFVVLFATKIRQTGSQELCQMLPDEKSCDNPAAKLIGCQWEGGKCHLV